jgi:ferredoxin--NADP+ reductase
MEDIPTYKFDGLAWLFLGVADTNSLIYDIKFKDYPKMYLDNFRYNIALRQEQKNVKGGKMYVDYKIEEYSEEVFKLLDEGACICFRALKGMMPEIQHTLSRVAKAKGENWEMKLSYIH